MKRILGQNYPCREELVHYFIVFFLVGLTQTFNWNTIKYFKLVMPTGVANLNY